MNLLGNSLNVIGEKQTSRCMRSPYPPWSASFPLNHGSLSPVRARTLCANKKLLHDCMPLTGSFHAAASIHSLLVQSSHYLFKAASLLLRRALPTAHDALAPYCMRGCILSEVFQSFTILTFPFFSEIPALPVTLLPDDTRSCECLLRW